MAVEYTHQVHPRVSDRRKNGPPRTTDVPLTLNGRIGLTLTTIVGTMWCAYAFAALALVVLPQALGGGPLLFIQWLSQTFIQLVMLSVIMVGQNIAGRASDRRSEMTYQDADAILHEAMQIQAHLQAQDKAIDDLLAKVARLEAGASAS